jgi:hypothetical protein
MFALFRRCFHGYQSYFSGVRQGLSRMRKHIAW